VVVIFFSIFCFFLSFSSSVFVFVFLVVMVAVFEISRDDGAPLFAFFFSFADDDDRSDGLPLLFPSLFFGVLEEEGDVPFSLALELVLLLSLLLLLFNIFFFFSSLYVTKFTTHLLHPRAAYLHLEHPGGFTEGGDILTRALCVCVFVVQNARAFRKVRRERDGTTTTRGLRPFFSRGALLSFF